MGLYLTPERCKEGAPSGRVSLLDVYGLREFANSVARQDPESGAKRKLRKSYKNHIADLPGKQPIPGQGETQWTLIDAAMRPAPQHLDDCLKSLEFSNDLLAKVKLQKSTTPIPNFDPKLLAAPGVSAGRDLSNPASPQAVASPRAASPSTDDLLRLEKRKRKEALPFEKRRRV